MPVQLTPEEARRAYQKVIHSRLAVDKDVGAVREAALLRVSLNEALAVFLHGRIPFTRVCVGGHYSADSSLYPQMGRSGKITCSKGL